MWSDLKGCYLLGNECILHSATRICGLYAINAKVIKLWEGEKGGHQLYKDWIRLSFILSNSGL